MAESLTQARRGYAYQHVQQWSSLERGRRQAMNNAVKGLGVALRMQGLAVTVGTLYKDDKTRPLAEALSRWLLEDVPRHVLRPGKDAKGGPTRRLLTTVAQADRAAYHAAQREALALAELLKVYAQVWDHGEE